VAEPAVYWAEEDPRARAGHQGIVARLVLDFQPFNMVNNKGFLIDKRLTMPQLKVHTAGYYADKVDKCYEKAKRDIQKKLDDENPDTVWISLDGWSAVTTSYIGVEICKYFFLTASWTNNVLNFSSLVYIHDWRRVKLCLGCTQFEEKHSSENLAKLVDITTDNWNIRHKVRQ
jgi:hypothetical protein